MSVGFPLGLLSLVALAPLTAAYFLRRRQRPVVVSALFLWRTPHQKAQAGPRLTRYTRELSFLLEALALLAAAAFVADVRFGSDAPAKHLVVLVDGSLSMSARPPKGPPVVERVRRAAAALVHDEGAAELTVVETGPRPRVLAGPRARASEALAALESWHPLGGAHAFGPSLALARELAGPGQRFAFFTDALPPAGEVLPEPLAWVALGEPADNLAFVAAQRRDEGVHAGVTVRVANFGHAARRAPVTFRSAAADGSGKEVVRTEEVDLPPDATAAVRMSFTGAGVVTVTLPDDALPEDGRLVLLPSAERALDVRLQEGLSPAVKDGLERFLQVAGSSAKGGPGASPLVFGPAESRADVTLGTRGALHAYVGPFFSEKDEPLLEDVDLTGVVWAAGDSPPGRPLVTANDVALVTQEGTRGEGPLHLNVDLGRSSLTRTQAWPVLLSNVLRRARQGQPGFLQRQVTLGAPLSVVTSPEAVFTLVGPRDRRTLMGHGLLSLPPPREPGRYALERDGRSFDQVEVLPIDPAESDLRARQSGAAGTRAGPPLAAASFGNQRSAWPLLAVLLLLAADYALTGRRRALAEAT